MSSPRALPSVMLIISAQVGRFVSMVNAVCPSVGVIQVVLHGKYAAGADVSVIHGRRDAGVMQIAASVIAAGLDIVSVGKSGVAFALKW